MKYKAIPASPIEIAKVIDEENKKGWEVVTIWPTPNFLYYDVLFKQPEESFVFDKSKVVPCPEKCTFNWQQFHKDLDVAIAHMIEEFDGFYPSKAKLWDLVQYSFVKSGGDNNSMKTVGEVIASPQYQERLKKRIKDGK